MIKFLSPLLLLGLLQSCSDANLQGGIANKGLKTNSPASGENIPATENGTTPPTSSDGTGVDPNLTHDETVINPGPVVNPSIIAGASLTCFESSPKVELRCNTKVNNVLTDLNPQGIFIIQGKTSSWSPLSFMRIQTGTYSAKLENPPAAYGVAMKFEKSEYAFTSVGTAALEFADLIKDGSLEALVPNSGSYPTDNFFLSETDVLNQQSPWEVKNSSRYGCSTDLPWVQVFTTQTNAGYEAFNGKNFVNLDTSCGSSATNGNIRLGQILKAKLSHFYQISHYRKTGAGKAPTAKMVLYWNGDKFEIETKNTAWEHDTRYVLSGKDDDRNTISFHETGDSDGNGTHIDFVKVLDFGSPL